MAAAGRQASWIALKWKEGWEKIPVVMAGHCLSTSALLFYIGDKLINGPGEDLAEKYRVNYTVVRPGDPRIARINNKSPIDNVGFFD